VPEVAEHAKFGFFIQNEVTDTTINKNKYMYILLYGPFTDTVRRSMPISVVKVKVKLPLCMP